MAEADIEATAWAMLSMVSDGSTLRVGHNRGALKQSLRWLRTRTAVDGSFGDRDSKAWLRHQAIATWAIAELGTASRYKIMAPMIRRAIDSLLIRLQNVDSVPIETLLLARLATRAARTVPKQIASEQPRAAAWRDLLDEVEVELDRYCPTELPIDPHARVRSALFWQLHPDRRDERVSIVVRELGQFEPLIATHPLTSLYYTILCYRAGGDAWTRLQKKLGDAPDLVHHDFASKWDPAGAIGERCGAVGTTAISGLLLTFYYRYARIEVGQ